MPPTPEDSPPAPAEPKAAQPPPGGFVPIVQRRLGSILRPDSGRRNTSYRNAQFFGEPEDDEGQFDTVRGHQTDDERLGVRSPRAATSSMSSGSTHLTALSSSPRSSQTSDWSIGIAQALAAAGDRNDDTPSPALDEQSEIEQARKMSLSSLSSGSPRRPLPPPIPPRSSLRKSFSSASHRNSRARSQSDAKPMPVPPSSEIPTMVYDDQEPEFEIVTHTVLHSYLDNNRSSLSGFGSGASSVRRSMTPSVASAYSTSDHSIISSISQPPPSKLTLQPTQPLRFSGQLPLPPPSPAPRTPLPIPVPGEIVIKAVCPIGESIVLCRIARNAPLESVRTLLATKFSQAAGVELDLLEHGFVLGYVNQLLVPGAGRLGARPGTAGSVRPGTAGNTPRASLAAPTSRTNSGRPGTAPSSAGNGSGGGGRTRSSSVSSVTADPTHLTLIVTQRDWESAVAKHGEKMTVRVLLA
ncbi:hypothetical protein FRC09_016938 [Ceratobasidium sp. 395]|nr:hypothetical protein FRC09_016938 [Ceratobasidium sp. 395]